MQSNKNSNKIFHTFLIVMFLLCPTQLLLSQPFFQQASFNLPFRMSLGVIRSAYVPAQHAIYILGGYEDQVGYSDKIIKVDLNSEQVSVLSTHLPFALQSDLTLIQVAYNNNDGNIYFFNKFDAYSFDPQTENISLIGSNISPEQVVYGISKYVSSQNAIYSFGNRGSSGGNFTLKYDITNNTVDPLTNTMQPGNNTSPAAAYCQSRDAIYLFGGNHSSFSFDIIQKFDPVSEIFTTLPITLPIISGGAAAAAVPIENAIYVFGGYDNSQNLDDVFKFDCSTETLQVMPDLPIALNSMGVEYVPSENRIYVLGGTTARTGGYTPATDAIYYLQLEDSNQPPDCNSASIADQSTGTNCQVNISGADVTGVTDPDGDPLTILASPTTLSLGANIVTVSADDGNGGTCSIDINVNVADETPPVLTAISGPIVLWPPNHKYRTITTAQLVSTVSDNCASLSDSDVTITKVTSDEPKDVKGGGDGNTKNDIDFVDCQTVNLRAERQGGGNGRVYTVYMTVSDGNGNTGEATAQIHVPHDKSATAVDDGESYDLTCGGSSKLALNPADIKPQATIPDGYTLEQNYPNPFNPTTEINFAIPEAGEVELAIYNLSGQLVRTLVSGQFPTGVHRVTWNATDDNGIRVASGMYLYVLKAGQYMDKKKLLLMK